MVAQELTTMEGPEADSCIVCLEDLAVGVPDAAPHHDDVRDADTVATGATATTPHPSNDVPQIALIKPCNHFLHDQCLSQWSQKANTCPICRQAFNLVEVLAVIGGPVISEYTVEDKKQVAEFDPSAWVEEESEDEATGPCPVCGGTDQPEVLLLCDACDAHYHTYCIGLEDVPQGDWFCMECAGEGAYLQAVAASTTLGPITGRLGPRTQASVRRTRRRIRNDGWVGTWSHISHRVHAAAGLDLDFSEDDQSMASYRRMQTRTARERRQFNDWQRRLNIAGRQGARDVFSAAAPPALQMRQPPTPVETVEESMAWGDFEKAKEMDTDPTPRGRKRKSRSATTSPRHDSSVAGPSEEPKEPERKLKRPRTRRIVDKSEPSTSTPAVSNPQPNGTLPHSSPQPIHSNGIAEPSFLSSLLKEVEVATTSDDNQSNLSITSGPVPHRVTSPSIDYSSPATSPTSSGYPTPRALSITPPPHMKQRSLSPLPLTSRVEPIFPPADYSPNRSPPESASKADHDHSKSPSTEIRQPRFDRQRLVRLPRSVDTSPERAPISPVRATMSIEAKESINKIVKSALAPHWKSAEITKEQYADINRDVSRKLYEIVAGRNIGEDKERHRYEKVAAAEVANAVKFLVASVV